MGIRAVCAQRLRQEARRGAGYVDGLVAELRRSEVAIETAAANAQHYEVPAAFFALVLGPHLKYSSGYWPGGVEASPCHRSEWSGLRAGELGAAEVAMLGLTAERAGLADGQTVLDLGCGWGSLTLWAAARFPRSRFTAISNSQSQRAYVEEQARLR